MTKPRVVLIIQARMGSKRLPGKSMMDLAGKPLLGRILERVKRCTKLNDIVLAIPETSDNLILKELGETYNIKVFLGSEHNLLERFYQAALWSNADIVGRLPADNATPEPSEIDRIVDFHLSLNTRGFSSNLSQINNSEYPDGIGAEMFNFSLLEEARFRQNDSCLLEHVHLNFFDYSSSQAVDDQWCPVNTIKCPEGFRRPELILDVNTLQQYIFMRKLYEHLYPKNPEFSIVDIIKWYDEIYLKSHSVSPESL